MLLRTPAKESLFKPQSLSAVSRDVVLLQSVNLNTRKTGSERTITLWKVVENWQKHFKMGRRSLRNAGASTMQKATSDVKCFVVLPRFAQSTIHS